MICVATYSVSATPGAAAREKIEGGIHLRALIPLVRTLARARVTTRSSSAATRGDRRRPLRRLRTMIHGDLDGRVESFEGKRSRDELVEHDAERVEIGR